MRRLLLLVLVAVVGCLQATRFEASSSEDADQPIRVSTLEALRRRDRVSPEAEALSGDDLIRYVNRKQSLWRARRNARFSSYSEKTKWGLMGVEHVRLPVSALRSPAPSMNLDLDIPESFDARTQWPQCESLRQIRDQSSCGSCWAFGAVEAMSDRICIASGGKIQVSLSADDLLSCCRTCGFGCNGGDPLAAWRYWVRDGIVTGSNYTQHQGCKPYPFPPCEHHSNKTHYSPCKHDLYPTPKCEHSCVASYTYKTYAEDKFFGKSAYGVKPTVEALQKEILTNGPVEVAFEVYEDFLNYAGGIYVGGVPYWIVANSWNTDWGEDGFFRIVRGVDECGIESSAVGGIPKLPSYARLETKQHHRHHHRATKVKTVAVDDDLI